MDRNAFVNKNGGAYLKSAGLCATRHLPAVLLPFMCSIPAANAPGAYAGLTAPQKALYNTESARYANSVKVANDARREHEKIANACISWLEDSFDNNCTARKNIQTITRVQDSIMDLQGLPQDRAICFRAINDMIKSSFSPTQCTDAEAILLKIADANFHDGRGFERNAVEFVENFEMLKMMSQPPLPLIMSKHLTKAVVEFDHCKRWVGDMVRAINRDIVDQATAVAAGGPAWVPPVPPRYQEFLDIMSADVKGTPTWDYISAGSGRSAMDVKKSAPGAPSTGYCERCGKIGHTKSECRGKRCVCGKALIPGQPGHNTRDALHDKSRADAKKYKEDHPWPPATDNRDLSRGNPKQQQGQKRKQDNRSASESQLDQDLKSNDKNLRRMDALMKSATRVADENVQLRARILAGVDPNLKAACNLIPPQRLEGTGGRGKGKGKRLQIADA
jgi:hypothetical protein